MITPRRSFLFGQERKKKMTMDKNGVPVKEAVKHMHADYVSVLRVMVDREKLSEDLSVDEVVERLRGKINSRTEEVSIAALLGAASRCIANKFARKLDFSQMCEVLALHRMGYNNELLSKVYGVNRRTVTHMYNPRSKHYRSVREAEKEVGQLNFAETYATPEAVAAMEAAKATVNGEVNNKLANGKAGIHMLRGPMCDYDHRVEIKWVEGGTHNVKDSGWYYRDFDSEWPEDFFHCGPESMKSSQACYTAAIIDISDKLS